MRVRQLVVPVGLIASLGCTPRPSADLDDPETKTSKPEPQKPVEVSKRRDTGARWIDLSIESEFGCAVERTGSVFCWGRDPAAEMTLRELPIQPPPDPSMYGIKKWGPASRVELLDDARAISTASALACAIVEDGRVRCWGSFRWGTQHVFDIPGIAKAVELEVGESESCATLESGDLWCWNAENFGVPVRRLGDVVSVTVGDSIACGLTKQGDVVCWGQGVADWHRYNTQFTQPTPPSPSTPSSPEGEVEYPDTLEVGRFRGAINIALSGWNNLCLVRQDGKLVCSERDVFAILRAEDLGMSEIANASGIAELSTTRTHGCGRTTDGHAQCWGRNVYGQLGDGSSTARDRTMTIAKLDDVVDLSTAEDSTCALTGAGGISCWGYDRGEALGREPVHVHTVTGLQASSIAAAGHLSCAVDASKQVRCWGSDSLESLGISAVSTPTALDLAPGHELVTLTSNWESCFLLGSGAVSCGTFYVSATGSNAFVPGTLLADVQAITNGQPPACVITTAGHKPAGRKPELQCGQSFAALEPEPAIKAPFALAASNMRACVAHGTGDVSCFAEYYGWSDVVHPAREFRAVAGIHDAVELSSAVYHDCALRKSGKVTCWVGRNETTWSEDGRTVATVTYRMSDIRDVEVEPAIQLVSGSTFHCVLTKAGAVRCWDDNPYNGDTTVWKSVPVLSQDIVEIAAGTEHTCARDMAGNVTCWGDDVWGQLGRVPSRVYLTPTVLKVD